MTVRTYTLEFGACIICLEPHQDCSTVRVGLRLSVEGGPLELFQVCETCVRNMMKPFQVHATERREGSENDPSQEILAALDSALKSGALGKALGRHPVFKASSQKHVGLYFTAENMAPGEVREVKAKDDFGDVKLFKLHKVWRLDDGGEWWLHDIRTDACKHRPDDQKYWCTEHKTDYGSAYQGGLCSQIPSGSKGWKFEPTSPLSSGTTMATCDPRSVVIIIENKGTERATFKAALLGVEARR